MHICCTDTPIFCLINYITPNSKLSCTFYAYISCLKYQSLKFDLPLVIVEIQPHLSKVASTALVFKSSVSHHGIPIVLESNNWPQFDSRDMKKLLIPVGFNISQPVSTSPKVVIQQREDSEDHEKLIGRHIKLLFGFTQLLICSIAMVQIQSI